MVIENCLILSAGKGTRMGKIGEVLPKPLWPIGKETLLSYQYKLAKKIGAKKIHINISHQADLIRKYVEDNNFDLIVHYEHELLDVGGTIQNLVNLGVQGNCLIINSDQLLQTHVSTFLSLINQQKLKNIATLFSVTVTSSERYNRFKTIDGNLVSITKFGEHDFHQNETYSGIGVVNLDRIKLDFDISERNFFKLLFKNLSDSKIQVINLGDNFFYDLGTREKYIEFLFTQNINQKFPELSLSEYFIEGFYNFGKHQICKAAAGSVIIDGNVNDINGKIIFYQGLIDQL